MPDSQIHNHPVCSRVKNMKTKLTACVILTVFLSILACAAVFAVDEWPMFKRTPERTGTTDTSVLGSYRPAPIWIFPYRAYLDNDYAASRDSADFNVTGIWSESSAVAAERDYDAYNDDYLYAAVAASSTMEATWQLKILMEAWELARHYYISVWIPEYRTTSTSGVHSSDAHYSVLRNGVLIPGATFIVDQTNDGRWARLGDQTFDIISTDTIQVVLTNETADADQIAAGAIVIADAVRLEPGNYEAYASPVAARRVVADNLDDLVITSLVETEPLPVTPRQSGTKDVGVVYGIYAENGAVAGDERGKPAWRFPSNPDNWISGGIYSTPAVTGSGANEVVVIPAMDGTVYVVTTSDGSLFWQGPGYFADGDGYTSLNASMTTAGWLAGSHAGYKGSGYWHQLAEDRSVGGSATATWEAAINYAAVAGVSSRKYAIYAWIPPSNSDHQYISDAHYTVTVGVTSTTARVNQSSGGRWVRIGNYYDIKNGDTVTVELKNETDMPLGGNAYVAADAVKIVPYRLGSFEYSSPVVSGNNIYVGSASGQVYKLTVGDEEPAWTYPDTDNPATPHPIGAIYASPAFDDKGDIIPDTTNDMIYVGSVDGHVYALDASGNEVWVYPSKDVDYVVDGNILDFIATASWIDSDPDPTKRDNYSYNDDYLYASVEEAIPLEWEDAVTKATWEFNIPMSAGEPPRTCSIYVWIPRYVAGRGVLPHTQYAHYAVLSDTTLLGHFTVDQTVNYGWVKLVGALPFQVEYNEPLKVVLSNETEDGGEVGNAVVIADAVKVHLDEVKTLAEISSTTAVGDKLYVGTGAWGSSGFVNDSAGRVLALDKTTGVPVWWYPSNPDLAATSVGSFVRSSPMLMDVGGESSVLIGSLDGNLYGLKTADGASLRTAPIDVGSAMYSSAAGTKISFYQRTDNTTSAPFIPDEDVPMAYVGTLGGQLAGLDLEYLAGPPIKPPKKDWWWNLYGSVDSSPALYNNRIYVADTSGCTWAFSTRSVGSGAEGWNTEIGDQPPDDGSDKEGNGRKADPEIDVFTKDQYENTILPALNSHGDPGFDATLGLHDTSARPREPKFIYEWGETMYFIVWNLLNPNTKVDPSIGRIPILGDPGFIDKTKSAVKINIQNIESGAGSGALNTLNVEEKGYFVDANINTVFYAVYKYEMNGEAADKSPAPGTTFKISVDEKPANTGNSTNSDSSNSNYIPKNSTDIADDGKWEPQEFSINNPIGLVYIDSTRFGGSADYYIGVDDGAYTTDRDTPGAGMNGCSSDTLPLFAPPYVRSEPATHGVSSKGQTLIVCDRSLLGAMTPAKSITKLRVDRRDLNWIGGPSRVVNGIFDDPTINPNGLGWEVMPPDLGPNVSPDYPDMTSRQVSSIMKGSAMNPVQENVELVAPVQTSVYALDGTDPNSNPRPTGPNPMGVSVSVPQFQPANMPAVINDENSYIASGYTGSLYIFVDSDGDGHLDRSGDAGSSTHRAEAYREVFSQAHVMPDRRVEVVEKTLDIGQVPHGFGFTLDTTAVLPANRRPRAFYDSLANIPASNLGPVSGGGFFDWFQPFNAYNQGNVNLINLRFAKRTDYMPSLNLYSDTVQDGGYIPGYWPSLAPYSCVVSALDSEFDGPGLLYGILSPLYASNLGTTLTCNRTFHKARVGEPAPPLMLPDYPKGFCNLLQTPPSVSVAVPVGTPVGTYYGKFTLYEDNPTASDGIFQLGAESVGNPLMNLVVGVTEARLTDGSTLGSQPHLDIGSPAPTDDVADVTPVAYRDPVTGNLHVIWSSTRYGDTILSRVPAIGPVTTDPSYLYISSMPLLPPLAAGSALFDFNIKTSLAAAQWWQPVTAADAFPALADINNYFPAPPLGAPGALLEGTVKITSPSVAIAGTNAWLLFGAQGYKNNTTPLPGNQGKVFESRIWYTPLVDGVPGASSYPLTDDWTMPKYGVRGLATQFPNPPNPPNVPSLWAFWYGGNNDKWRIYYNVKPDMTNTNPQTNAAQLPVPNGLSWTAEPSPVFWPVMNPISNVFDVIYSGYSTYHKNSDIYLSRYLPGDTVASVADGGHWPMALRNLPMRDTGTYAVLTGLYTELRRDPAKGIWYSRDADWDTSSLAAIDIRVFPDRSDLVTPPDQVTSGTPIKDKQTGAWAYTYNNTSDPVEVALRSTYRAVIVDPAAGTVKFMNAPGADALVVAKFTPRAYRLTTDSASDVSPFALLDSDLNPRYLVSPLSFVNCSGAPRTDRLWVFWRRTALDKPGSGIYYKTYRYMVRLNQQIAVPTAANLAIVTDTAVPTPNLLEAEIDWINNRLLFTSADAGKEVSVTYYPRGSINAVSETHVVEFAEEMAPAQGSAFGSLTRLVVNEGQISAFKDPLDNKIWVFWTSNRSGNTDVYYEAISPRFYGVEYR